MGSCESAESRVFLFSLLNIGIVLYDQETHRSTEKHIPLIISSVGQIQSNLSRVIGLSDGLSPC